MLPGLRIAQLQPALGTLSLPGFQLLVGVGASGVASGGAGGHREPQSQCCRRPRPHVW